MRRICSTPAILFLCGFLGTNLPAQPPSPAEISDTTELASLTKKIDEQNTKIDALSQQILRLQQEIEQMKGAPSNPPVATAVGEASSPAPAQNAGGSTHVVARGETLTSIARMHKVTIDELQKLNHIEDARKLQPGQTLLIPGAQSAAPSPSTSATPNE